jgi:3-oxocholest-4-en-26-oate---CoA ligase
MEFQLADLFECLCDARPDAAVLVAGNLRRTRSELEARANRLAHVLLDAGVRSGDRVGVYAYNRLEWVEALVACWKIRAAAININYRYVSDELRYLWDNAEMSALVYERSFGPRVAELAAGFPALRSYLVLEDGDAGAGPGERYEDALAASSPERDFDPRSGDDLYMVYTGGTTGMPKGVLWRHEDLYSNVVRPFAGGIERPEAIVKMADNPLKMRMLTLSPLMHGGGQSPLFLTILNGGVGLFPVGRRFDPDEVLSIIEKEGATTLSIIGDAMGRPLAEAKLDPTRKFDTRSLVAISTGGALLSEPVRALLREAFGRIYIGGGIGGSEIGGVAKETRATAATAGPRFKLDPTVAVLDESLRPIEPGSGKSGRLARSGHIPLGYFKDAKKTAETFVTDARGVRWVLPGDWARVEEDGTITLLGRGSACINSGGEKIFPDEVEAVIARHPDVRGVSVIGVPDPKWMERVVALIELQPGAEPLDLEALQAHCRAHLAGYKIPRELVLCEIQRLPTGKVDHVWARRRAQQARAGSD